MKRTIILLAIFIPIVICYTTGYVGDVPYFVFVDDGSWRNGLMRLLCLPVFYLTGSIDAVVFCYVAGIGLIYIKFYKYLKTDYLILLCLFSPYVMFCSKDSLAVVVLSIGLFVLYKEINRPVVVIVLSLVCMLRPYLTPIALLFYYKNNLFVIKIVASVLLIVFGFIFIFNDNLLYKLLGYYTAYPVKYFMAFTDAGTTDFEFIYEFGGANEYEKIILILLRTFAPVWMLQLQSITAKLYFFMYVTAAIGTIYFINKYIKTRIDKIVLYLGVLCVLIAIGPLVVSNAGSAARYMATIPFFSYFISMVLNRKM